MNPQTYYPSEGRLEIMSQLDDTLEMAREEMPHTSETLVRAPVYRGIVTRLIEYFQDNPAERKFFNF